MPRFTSKTSVIWPANAQFWPANRTPYSCNTCEELLTAAIPAGNPCCSCKPSWGRAQGAEYAATILYYWMNDMLPVRMGTHPHRMGLCARRGGPDRLGL